MRKSLIFISIILVCFSLIGCDQFNWTKYRSREYKFSMLIPRTWEIDDEAKDAALVLYAPEDSSQKEFRSNMRVVVQDLPIKDMPLSTYYEINREELLNVFPKHKNIAEGQGMTGLVRYQWFAFDALIMEGVEVRAISSIWIKGQRMYLFTCVMNIKAAAKVEPLFHKMISSFRL